MRIPVALILAFAWHGLAIANPPGAAAPPSAPVAEKTAERRPPPTLSGVADLSTYTGAAVGAQLRYSMVGVRLTGGWNPVMLSVTDSELMPQSFHIFSTGQINADVFALPFSIGESSTDVGVSAGYRFNSLLGSGYGGSIEGQVTRWDHVGVHAFWGLTFYPGGEDRLVEAEGFAEDDRFNFPFGARIQTGIGVGLLLH